MHEKDYKLSLLIIIVIIMCVAAYNVNPDMTWMDETFSLKGKSKMRRYNITGTTVYIYYYL